MGREGSIVEQTSDWFSGEVNRGDFLKNDTKSFAFSEGNFDDVAGGKFLVGRIGKKATLHARAENAGRNDLIKHDFIITDWGGMIML